LRGGCKALRLSQTDPERPVVLVTTSVWSSAFPVGHGPPKPDTHLCPDTNMPNWRLRPRGEGRGLLSGCSLMQRKRPTHNSTLDFPTIVRLLNGNFIHRQGASFFHKVDSCLASVCPESFTSIHASFSPPQAAHVLQLPGVGGCSRGIAHYRPLWFRWAGGQ
jgi:hypothetical protein